MGGIAGSSYGLFALVWGLMCIVAAAVVTDAMLRGTPVGADLGAGRAAEAAATEA